MKALCPGPCHGLLVALVVQCICAPHLHASDIEPTLKISPQKIEIHAFYHGTTLLIKGTVPADSKVALVVSGKEKAHTLKRKDRVGPLWMNVETVTIKGVPEMYFLATSTDTQKELGPPEFLAKHAIGYDALRASTIIEQENSDHDSTFREFIKLKEHMGLYKTFPHSIELDPLGENSARLALSLPIPPMVPPGEYGISMYCFEDDQPLSNKSTKLTVQKVGLPEKLSALAFDHAALYGILAIVVAIAAGLFMGFLFGKKGKGGH
jgi:uncharacterized protein (TIGR02186 family)